MIYRVQEISVDGSHVHDREYAELANAAQDADRIAAKGVGSPWLVGVRVYEEPSGREVYYRRVPR